MLKYTKVRGEMNSLTLTSKENALIKDFILKRLKQSIQSTQTHITKVLKNTKYLRQLLQTHQRIQRTVPNSKLLVSDTTY